MVSTVPLPLVFWSPAMQQVPGNNVTIKSLIAFMTWDSCILPNHLSNEVKESATFSFAYRVHADDFAFHKLLFFKKMTWAI